MNPLSHPRWLLQAEGAVLLAAAVLAYTYAGGPWWVFALLFFAPDVSALGYLANAHVGATLYNLVHAEVLPALVLAAGVYAGRHILVLAALIWLGHIGLDRLAGFGLKYPTKFPDTHLQHV